MLRLTPLFLLFVIVTAILGFGGVIAGLTNVAKIIFFISVAVFVFVIACSHEKHSRSVMISFKKRSAKNVKTAKQKLPEPLDEKA